MSSLRFKEQKSICATNVSWRKLFIRHFYMYWKFTENLRLQTFLGAHIKNFTKKIQQNAFQSHCHIGYRWGNVRFDKRMMISRCFSPTQWHHPLSRCKFSFQKNLDFFCPPPELNRSIHYFTLDIPLPNACIGYYSNLKTRLTLP